MSKEKFIQAWKLVQQGPKRKFKQSAELIINLKELDLKKPEQQVDLFIQLPHPTGRPIKICALTGAELTTQAKQNCDTVVPQEDFKKWEDKKKIKKLADEHQWFIAQATIMPDVAKYFGKILGPKGKMPNPKAGCVVPPNANLKPLIEKLKTTTRVQAKTQLNTKCMIGKEDMDENKAAENMMAIYQQVISKLPGEKSNIKNVLVKLTMGKPIKVQL